MNENFKFYAKLSAVSALKWVLIFIPGFLITLIFALITGFQSTDLVSPAGGHAGIAVVYVYLVALAMSNPCAFAILIGAPVFLTLYFLIANKVAIQTIIFGIWKNKGAHHLEPLVKNVVDRYAAKRDWTTKTMSQAKLRAGLLDANRKDPNTSGLTKRAINYAFKKIRLDETELDNESLTMGDVISVRVTHYISESTQPGFTAFWIVFVLQVVLFICSQVFFNR